MTAPPKCEACPVPGAVPCIARTTGHARFCELAADPARCDYRRLIAEKSTGAPSGIACPDDPPPDPGPAAEAPALVPLSVNLERRRIVRECDYRGPLAQCGCNALRVCWMGKGSRPDPEAGYGHVSDRDCLDCAAGVDRRYLTPGAPPG